MEAVRKKGRRGHSRKKARQQHEQQHNEHNEQHYEQLEADAVPAELLAAMEAMGDVPPLEDVEVAGLDDEIAENEEALLAILGADSAAADERPSEDELLVAEASGSFPGNHNRGDDGPVEQPSGFAAATREERQGSLSLKAPSAPTFELEGDSPAEAAAEPAFAPFDAISPSAPAFDFIDAHETDHYTVEDMNADATLAAGIAAPSAPPMFHESEDENAEAVNGDVKGTSLENPIQPQKASKKVQLEPPPTRPTAPLAFHSVMIETDEVSSAVSASAPSAPLNFEIDEDYAAYRETPRVASAPSLSPTSSKQLRHTVSFEDPAKLESVTRAHLRVDSNVSAKNASVAVRASLANSKVSDAHRSSIYPSVPATSSDIATKETATTLEERKTYENLLKKQHIRVNLEPFVNFEMNLMRAEASQKRQEMKMRHIESNKGELYARLERYLFSEYILRTASSSLEAAKFEIDTLVKKGAFRVFAMYFCLGSQSTNKRCSDVCNSVDDREETVIIIKTLWR